MANLSIDDSVFAYQHLDRGMAYHRQNMLHEALFEYDTALALIPDDKYVHWNRAVTLLALGEYEEGFKEHDWAWKLFDWRGFGPVGDDMDRIRHLPIWHGEDISSDRLLVYHELGFGDAIQTLRYLPALKARAEHVTLVINPELVRLATPFGIEVVDHVPADVSDYTYRLPFFGVLSALKQTLHNIPNKPYIATKWPERTGNRIGICWSGRTQTAFTLEYFLSKLNHQGFELHSLQLGPVDANAAYPLVVRDFADTADLIASMDHIVTIDSSPAHLAGAVGHPSVHLLLPFLSDWRWWFAQTWYPTIKTYKQLSVGDWDMPFTNLNEALRGH